MLEIINRIIRKKLINPHKVTKFECLRNRPNKNYSCEDINRDECGDSKMQFDVECSVIPFSIRELNNKT
jgi:hypothetical protein